MKLVHFGAGNIGRSLVGSIFSRAGWEVVFVDTQENIINALNRDHFYEVIIKETERNDSPDMLKVTGVSGILAGKTAEVIDAVTDCDLVSTAVGANALKFVLPVIAQAVERRKRPLSVMFCENLHSVATYAEKILRDNLPEGFKLDGRLGLVETSIGKMVPMMPEEVSRSRPLEVWGEAYNKIIADIDGFAGVCPEVEGLELRHNFNAYVDRKLYIHNLGHATAAWHGWLHGKKYIWECIADPWIYSEIRGVMQESAKALETMYCSVYEDCTLEEYIADLLVRFANRELWDTTFRVGRDLKRKLAGNDRVIGALKNCLKYNHSCEHIIRSLACALCFAAEGPDGQIYSGDKEVRDSISNTGIISTIIHYCFDNKEMNFDLISKIIERFYSFCPDKYL